MFKHLLNTAKSSKRVMVHCTSKVDKSAIRREVRRGIEHIIISSKTLPDDIVMNGILYPAKEIESSYKGLERTLAPVEHPEDEDGNFIPALDAEAINNFHVGAFNENVRREDGRVLIDKVINVPMALSSEKGRRLLDRVYQFERGESDKPIHTSVGLFMEIEELKVVKTNSEGLEYDRVGKNYIFDHDAILLDSVGAAQPSQGVGMMVNSAGSKVEVYNASLDELGVNELSHNQIREILNEKLRESYTDWVWVSEVFQDHVIYEVGENTYFKDFYTLENGEVKIVGSPFEVKREVTYVPITNEENDMKELILNALEKAGVEHEGLSDEQLMKKYSELLTTNSESEPDASLEGGKDSSLAIQVKELKDMVSALNHEVKRTKDKDLDTLVESVYAANSLGLDKEDLKKLGVEALKKLAGNAGVSVGIPFTNAVSEGGETQSYEMPD